MAIKARDYIAKLPEREQEAIAAEARKLIAEELSLAGIREARRQSQVALANRLGVQQPAVSKIERQTDLYLSTLREYIEAMGGTLELIARVPRSRAGADHRLQASEATKGRARLSRTRIGLAAIPLCLKQVIESLFKYR